MNEVAKNRNEIINQLTKEIKMKHSKFIKTYEDAFVNFFKKESITLKTNPDIFDFAVRYSAFIFGLANHCTEIEQQEFLKEGNNLDNSHSSGNIIFKGTKLDKNHMKRFEIPELVFFGLRDMVKPTHLYLSDKRAFWSLFGYLYTYIEFPSFMVNEIKLSCLEQDRLTVNLSERNRCMTIFKITSEIFFTVLNHYINNKFLVQNRPILEAVTSDMIANRTKNLYEGKLVSSRKFCNQLARSITYKTSTTLKSLFDSNGKLTFYRGSDIDRTENIRLNRTKKSNPLSHVQQSGIGMSFTPLKDGAVVYSLSKFKDTLTLSNNERVFNKSSIKFDFLDINKNSFLDTTSKIPVLGTYSADMKDILVSQICSFGSDSDLHSSEIVFFPDSVKLIDYRILNNSTPVKIFDKVA